MERHAKRTQASGLWTGSEDVSPCGGDQGGQGGEDHPRTGWSLRGDRQGLGRALLSDALAEARSLSLRRILAMVVEDNRAGLGFFLERGFEETGIHLPGFRQLARVVHGADRQPPLEISI